MAVKKEEDSSASSSSRPVRAARPAKLSAEEKKKRLAEMMSDAQTHEDAAFERLLAARRKDKAEDAEMAARAEKDEEGGDKASFINNMNKTAYSGSESLSERLNKGRHYRQKGSTENHSFL